MRRNGSTPKTSTLRGGEVEVQFMSRRDLASRNRLLSAKERQVGWFPSEAAQRTGFHDPPRLHNPTSSTPRMRSSSPLSVRVQPSSIDLAPSVPKPSTTPTRFSGSGQGPPVTTTPRFSTQTSRTSQNRNGSVDRMHSNTNHVPVLPHDIRPSVTLARELAILLADADAEERAVRAPLPSFAANPSAESLVENNWHNGTNLSELIAQLMTESRELVKEVDHYDEFGRLLQPPRLMLVGTEPDVRSPAAALNNLRVCLSTLATIPNFPRQRVLADELFTDGSAMRRLLRDIQDAFGLGPIFHPTGRPLPVTADPRRRILPSRNNRSRSLSPRQKYKDIIVPPSASRRQMTSQKTANKANTPVSPRLYRTSNSSGAPIASNGASISGLERMQNKAGGAAFFRHLPNPPRWSGVSGSNRIEQRVVLPDMSSHYAYTHADSDLPHMRNSLSHSHVEKTNDQTGLRGSMDSHLNRLNKRSSSAPARSRVGTTHLGTEVDQVESPMDRVASTRAYEARLARLSAQRRARRQRREETTQHRPLRNPEQTVTPGGSTDFLGGPRIVGDTFSATGRRTFAELAERRRIAELARTQRLGLSTDSNGRPITVNKPIAGSWSAPRIDRFELEFARRYTFPNITPAQQSTVRDWLLSLGVSIMEGEGGFLSATDEYGENSYTNPLTGSARPIEPLPLSKDRLRNGELLCEIFCILEPAAAVNAHLRPQIIFAPVTIAQALANVERVLWLLRLLKCPPIPLPFLALGDEIISGRRDVIWGLLWELMQTYSVSTGQAVPNPTPLGTGALGSFGSLAHRPVNLGYYNMAAPQASGPSIRKSVSSRNLPYLPEERRQLDQSLLDWLEDVGVLRTLTGSLPRPPTVLCLESYIKDGTLLCLLVTDVLGLRLAGNAIHHPHGYTQCVTNVNKALDALRHCPSMDCRYLTTINNVNEISEDIVRGHWDTILGLLEDMHCFHDRLLEAGDEFEDIDAASGGEMGPGTRASSSKKGLQWRSGGRLGGKPSERFLTAAERWKRGEAAALVLPPRDIPRPYLGRHWMQKRQEAIAAGAPPTNTVNPSNRYDSERLQSSFESALASASQNTESWPSPNTTAPESLVGASAGSGLDQHLPFANDSATSSTRVSLDRYRNTPIGELTSSTVIPNHNSQKSDSVRLSAASFLSGLATSAPVSGSKSKSVNTQNWQGDEALPGVAPVVDLVPSIPSDSKWQQDDVSVSVNKDQKLGLSAKKIPLDHTTLPVPVEAPMKENESEGDADSLGDGDIAALSDAEDSPIDQPTKSLNSLPPTAGRAAVVQASDSARLDSILSWLSPFGLAPTNIPPLNTEHLHRSSTSRLRAFGDAFVDGVLLGKLSQRLERSTLPGFEATPRHPAQRLQNVRRTLEFFAERNRRLPITVLSCEEAICNGDGMAVLNLLEYLRRAYPHFRP